MHIRKYGAGSTRIFGKATIFSKPRRAANLPIAAIEIAGDNEAKKIACDCRAKETGDVSVIAQIPDGRLAVFGLESPSGFRPDLDYPN
jgi:hypothetical protein